MLLVGESVPNGCRRKVLFRGVGVASKDAGVMSNLMSSISQSSKSSLMWTCRIWRSRSLRRSFMLWTRKWKMLSHREDDRRRRRWWALSH